MITKNSNISIDQKSIKKKITNSKYSIINNENEIIQGIEISKDNELFSSNNNNQNIITLNIDSSFIEKNSNKFFYKKKGNTFQFLVTQIELPNNNRASLVYDNISINFNNIYILFNFKNILDFIKYNNNNNWFYNLFYFLIFIFNNCIN